MLLSIDILKVRPGFLAIVLLLIAPVLLPSMASGRVRTDSDTLKFEGTVWAEITHDSLLTIHYDLIPVGFSPDSIAVLAGYPAMVMYRHRLDAVDSVARYQRIIYRRSPDSAPPSSYRIKKGKLYVKGAVTLPILEPDVKPTDVYVRGYLQDQDDSTRVIGRWARLYDFVSYSAIGMEFFGVAGGYFRSKLDQPLDDDGMFLGWGLAMGVVHPRWAFMTSTSWSGLGKHFAFSEPIRGEVRWLAPTHAWLNPELAIGASLSKLKVSRGGQERRDIKAGIDVGGTIAIPFHRFSYRYSTALGGYHTAELYVAIGEDSRDGSGTTYRLRSTGEVWTFSVALNLSFVNMKELIEDNDWSTRIDRHDGRPLLLKILSYPVYVSVLPVLVFTKITHHEP